MYYDDNDDNPYAPRIGPAAMPSRHSKFAPYFSGRTDEFDDFLKEFESLASDCKLTDPQRVDALVRYVDSSTREFCKVLNGYSSRDWPLFQQSLIDVFRSIVPRHRVRKQKLRAYVQESSGRRMECMDDVLWYYQKFLCLSAPLVHTGHLSKEDRNAAFFDGFHPKDRKLLIPRLLAKHPFQPYDIPFHFEDIYDCACGAFAYYDRFYPFWLPNHPLFKPPSVRREWPFVSSAETTTTPFVELPTPSPSTPVVPAPSSYSSLASELQHAPVPSAMEDKSESKPEATFDRSALIFAPPCALACNLVYGRGPRARVCAQVTVFELFEFDFASPL